MKKKRRFVLKIIIALTSLGAAWAAFLSVNMLLAINRGGDFGDKERTVIVLGCQVLKNGEPSPMLVGRLAAARDVLLENENFSCVVTGGRGANEPAAEASVMRDWLIENGVPAEKIFTEDESTDTRENLRFARDVVARNNLADDIVIVSDGFHLYRAELNARPLFDEIHTLSVKTRSYKLVFYWVREWAALTRDFVFG
ncbi:MAG: YdcF family protein [Oscillospiraceae bacterium]|jgi:vancomycin permeability regulator SanA|nr:YdcF family protein [Oscillospiraceae bacterium]